MFLYLYTDETWKGICFNKSINLIHYSLKTNVALRAQCTKSKKFTHKATKQKH